MSKSKYFIATICCSTRFREDIIKIYNELTERERERERVHSISRLNRP